MKTAEVKYQTIKVIFSATIEEINKGFTSYYSSWHVGNLKEWIENYKTSSFTQIDERTAIISSDYNMGNIREWLSNNLYTESVEILN